MKIVKDFELKEITTFHLPARCAWFATYDSEDELRDLLAGELCKTNKVMQIGGGSNLVFTSDFDGVILNTEICHIGTISQPGDEVVLRVGSGVVWDDLVKYCVEHNYYGIENMSYIPGKVGASAVQNIGSYGAEVKDVITRVRTMCVADGSIRYFDNSECRYAYRDSIFKKELKGKYIVTEVEYKLSTTPRFNLEYGPLKRLADLPDLTIAKVRDEIIAIRCAKLPDPKYVGSVGSFFTNPIVDRAFFEKFIEKHPDAPHYLLDDGRVKIPAGWLIEHSGLKGHRCGGAVVWEKQCLVIANIDNALPDDVVRLYRFIIETVKDSFGVELVPEANII